MNRRTFTGAAASLLARAETLFEEDLAATTRSRIEQVEQIRQYTAALPDKPLASAPKGDALVRAKAAIGFPAPGLKARGRETLEKVGEDGIATYHRCRVRLSDHVETYGLWLVPRGLKGRAPLLISQHGGSGFPELALYHGGANYHDMIRGAVREGYVVFAPLTIMHPRRDGNKTTIPEDVRGLLDAPLRAKGTSLAAVDITKIVRALDVLAKRPEVDASRIGMTGLSFGGGFTVYTAALDRRIKAAAPSCCFRHQPPQPPSGGRLTDMWLWEVAASIAPRPLHMQAGVADPLLEIAEARQCMAKVKSHYEAEGAADRVEALEFDGKHEFRGEPVWRFFRKWL